MPCRLFVYDVSKSYRDSVEALRETFTKLELVVDGIPCVRVDDPAAKAVLLAALDADGDGWISETEATGSYKLGIFADNTEVRNLDLSKFTGFYNTYDGTFYGCTNLESIILPEGLTTLRYQSFMNCTSLVKVVLPQTLTTMNNRAFYNCPALKEIEIPDSVTTIENSAFYECGIERLVYPEGITTVNMNCAACKYWEVGSSVTTCNHTGSAAALETFIIHTVTPPAVEYFFMRDVKPLIYVSDEAVDAYKAATWWSGRAAYIRPLSRYTE